MVSGFLPLRLIDVLPADRIPALERPRFEAVSAVTWLADREPVVVVQLAGQARAYPVEILLWHAVVDDAFGAREIVVTYCALCDSAAVYDRTILGHVHRFAGSGKLYLSDDVMYDTETQSLWPQITGQAVEGDLRGAQLDRIPAQVVPYSEFRAAFPNGEVLSRNTGFDRPYGTTAYAGYERAAPVRSFLLQGPDRRLRAAARVLGVSIGGVDRAYPFDRLASAGAVQDRVGGRDVLVVWSRGMASAEDTPSIASGRDAGWAGAFVPEVLGRPARFSVRAGRLVDSVTSSSWDALGRAVAGPARGARLTPVVSTTAFWFSWAAFHPATSIWGSRAKLAGDG